MLSYYKQLQNHGMIGFSHKVLGFIDQKIFGREGISATIYRWHMRRNKPYFGNYLSANQGTKKRHLYMEQLMKALAEKNSPGSSVQTPTHFSVLEVGSYAGASAVVWASSLQKYFSGNGRVVCVDPWDLYFKKDAMKGTDYQLQNMNEGLSSGEIKRLFDHNIRSYKLDHLVSPMKCFFQDCYQQLVDQGQTFDLIYIDGDHRYSQVLSDFKMANALLKDGGVLCGDDLEMQQADVDPAHSIANMDADFVVDPKTQTFYHPGVTRAVHDFFGTPVSAWNGFWAMKKTGSTFNQIVLK